MATQPYVGNAQAPAIETELWPTLRSCWHPVAVAAEIGSRPVAVQLLGERLALVRLGDSIVAFRDLCIHRGTALSLGWIQGDTVVCAYHGWRYDRSGACVEIPSIPPNRPIPPKARAQVFTTAEQYGLVWVCLERARAPIPEFPEFTDATYTAEMLGPYHWECSAARAIENFTDLAHFPWIHEGILGDRRQPETPVFDITRAGEELRYGFQDKPTAVHPVTHRRDYRLTRPFTIHLRQPREDSACEAIFFAVSPTSAKRSVQFMIVARNFTMTLDEHIKWRRVYDLVADQDAAIVASQRPEELPVDLAAELHIKGPDAVAVEYRRFMAELGVNVDA